VNSEHIPEPPDTRGPEDMAESEIPMGLLGATGGAQDAAGGAPLSPGSAEAVWAAAAAAAAVPSKKRGAKRAGGAPGSPANLGAPTKRPRSNTARKVASQVRVY
jgi:hypothetical protein